MDARRLERVADEALLAGLQRMVRERSRVDAAIVGCLIEVERRKLFAREGYPSLWAYCLGALGLSEGATAKRIAAARVGRRFPLALEMLASGQLHLTAVSMLARHLTQENHEEVLRRARGLSKPGLEELMASLAPRPDVPDSIRKLPVSKSRQVAAAAPAAASPQTGSGSAAGTAVVDGAGVSKEEAAESLRAVRAPGAGGVNSAVRSAPGGTGQWRGSGVEALAPGRYKVQLTVSAAVRDKLERARDLLRHVNPDGDLDVVLERALDALLDRLERERFGKTDKPRASAPPVHGSRHIAQAVRREVVERDGEGCAYVSPDGKRCGSRAFLEFHHLEAHARGGGGDASNVALYCAAHNRYVAQVELGEAHVRRKMAEREQMRLL